MCVCLGERERKRETERDRQTDRQKDREGGAVFDFGDMKAN